MSTKMLYINKQLQIPDNELIWRFSTSGGPGGQHANKTSTRVELVFDISESETLTNYQRITLQSKFGSKISVICSDTKSQHRNKEIATEKLIKKLRKAFHKPKKRRPTRPTRGSKERRLKAKRQRSQTKSQRRRPME